MRIALPENYPSGECVLVPIDTALVPLVAAALAPYLERRIWTENGYQAGYRAFTEVLANMTNNCVSALVDEIRAFRGLKPAYVSTPPDERTIDMYQSLNDLLQASLEARGIMVDGWITDQFASLADIVQTQRGLDKTNGVGIWDTVAGLLSGAGSVATIADTLVDFLTAQEETAVEGGLLITLCAMTAANSAMMQAMSMVDNAQLARLDSILEALRGATAPSDNILQALRGDEAASATRNMAEFLE